MSVDIGELNELNAAFNRYELITRESEGAIEIYAQGYGTVCKGMSGEDANAIIRLFYLLPEIIGEIDGLRKIAKDTQLKNRPMTSEEVKEYCKDEFANSLWKEEKEPDQYTSHWMDVEEVHDWFTRPLIYKNYRALDGAVG